VAFCGNCGNGLEPNTAFCNKCGQRQNISGSTGPAPTYLPSPQESYRKQNSSFNLSKEFSNFFSKSKHLFFLPSATILISVPISILFTLITGKSIYDQTFSILDNKDSNFSDLYNLIWNLIWFGKITILDNQFNKLYLGISLSGISILSTLIIIYVFKVKNIHKLTDSKLDASRLLFGSLLAWVFINIIKVLFSNSNEFYSPSYIWGLPHLFFLLFIFPFTMLLIMSQDYVKENSKLQLYFRILVRPFKLFVNIIFLSFIFIILLFISSYLYPNIEINQPSQVQFGFFDLILSIIAIFPSIFVWIYSSGFFAAPLASAGSPYPIINIVANSLNGYVKIYLIILIIFLTFTAVYKERVQHPKSSESSNKNIFYFGLGTFILHSFLLFLSFVWFGDNYISVPWQFIWGSPLIIVIIYAVIPKISNLLKQLIPLQEYIFGENLRPHKSWDLKHNKNRFIPTISNGLFLIFLIFPLLFSGISRFTWSNSSAERSAKNIMDSIISFNVVDLNSFLPKDKQLVLNDINKKIIDNAVKETKYKDLTISVSEGLVSASALFLLDNLEVNESINLVSSPAKKFGLFPIVSWTIQNELPSIQGNRMWNSVAIDSEQKVMPGWYKGEISGKGFQAGQSQLTAAFFDDLQVDVDLKNITLPAGWPEKSLKAYSDYLFNCQPQKVEGNKVSFCGGIAETKISAGTTISADYVTASPVTINKETLSQFSQITKVSCPANASNCIDALELLYETKFAAKFSNTYVQVSYRGNDKSSTATFEGSGVSRIIVTLVMYSTGEVGINEIRS